ncbi:MAG: transcription elongation factor GreA [Actinomycetota bacterium]
MSAQTLERIKRELEDLVTRGREAMGERLQRAREFGDIRENAEYDAAKDAQAMMEARIRQLQHMVKYAVVREIPAQASEAVPGVVVSVRQEGSSETEDYLLAATTEERVTGAVTISVSSPLGSALLGKQVGDTARVQAPGGIFSVEVISLRPAE